LSALFPAPSIAPFNLRADLRQRLNDLTERIPLFVAPEKPLALCGQEKCTDAQSSVRLIAGF